MGELIMMFSTPRSFYCTEKESGEALMELDALYLQARKSIALSGFPTSVLSVLGPYLNESGYKTLTSITCCISKNDFVPNNNFSTF